MHLSDLHIDKFSDRLKFIIGELQYSVSAFAKEIGHERGTTMSNAVNGRNLPNSKVLLEICSRFPEVNFDFLIAGRGKPFILPQETTEERPTNLHVAEEKPEYEKPDINEMKLQLTRQEIILNLVLKRLNMKQGELVASLATEPNK